MPISFEAVSYTHLDVYKRQPAILIFILVSNLITDIKEPYGGYPQWALNIGWAMVILLPVVAFIFSRLKTAQETDSFLKEQE